MKPIGHIITSSAVALGFGLIFKSYSIGLISWLAGWIIDFDHLLDYFLYLRKFKTKLNLQEFFAGTFFDKLSKIYILAHAWEYLISFIIFGQFFLSWQFVLAISLSYLLHLLLDQFTHNKKNFFLYFLTYRIKVNFNKNILCPNSI